MTTGFAQTAITVGGRPGSIATLNFLRRRRLSWATLERLGVVCGAAYFRDLGREAEALLFPYGEAFKGRAIEEKAFTATKGCKLAFWNLGNVLADVPATVYVTEGELDACALVEAGIPINAVLSIPTGAQSRDPDKPPPERGYRYVEEAMLAGLNRVKRFVWCGDEDSAGHTLRSDLATLLGSWRFHFVTWPEGCKDANDVLRAEGSEALRDLVMNGSLPWPIDGLYRMSELPEPAPLTLWSPGFAEWESKVMLAPTMLSVVTGHPNHGKTALWTQLWFQVSKHYDVPICQASFETSPKPHLRRQLRSLLGGKMVNQMTGHEIAAADAWIDEHFIYVAHRERQPDLAWLLDKAEAAVMRYGAKVIQVDPWNNLENGRAPRETETDYIRRCLLALREFARNMNVHVQILAHPSKMDRRGIKGKPVPELEDISGSKHWDNIPDQGFTVHRPKLYEKDGRRTEAILIHQKARFEELGYPCELALDYKLDTRRFVSTDYQ